MTSRISFWASQAFRIIWTRFSPIPSTSSKSLRIGIDYLKGIFSEMLDQAAGHYRSDALDQARSKIFLYPYCGGGHYRFEC